MTQILPGAARLAIWVDKHVGDRIRRRRAMLGLTQERLAEALGISYQQIQKYETGANRVSAGRLYQLARRLEVDVGYFFEGVSEGDGDGGEERAGGSSRSVIELVRNFQQIDDEAVRGSVLALVRSLATGESGAR